MRKREFIMPTEEEIAKRREMYEKAEELGIDLMNFDDEKSNAARKQDRRRAIIFLGTNQEVPKELKERLCQKTEKDREFHR